MSHCCCVCNHFAAGAAVSRCSRALPPETFFIQQCIPPVFLIVYYCFFGVHPFASTIAFCATLPFTYLYLSSRLRPYAEPQAGASVSTRSPPPWIQSTKFSIVPEIRQLVLLGETVEVRLRGRRKVRDHKSSTLKNPWWLTTPFEPTGSREIFPAQKQ